MSSKEAPTGLRELLVYLAPIDVGDMRIFWQGVLRGKVLGHEASGLLAGDECSMFTLQKKIRLNCADEL